MLDSYNVVEFRVLNQDPEESMISRQSPANPDSSSQPAEKVGLEGSMTRKKV